MNHPARSRFLFVAAALALATSAVMARPRADDEKKADDGARPSKLAKDMVGTWVLAGTPDKPEDPPAKGGRLKFFTGKAWCITESGAADGKVIFHHGGTYTLDGDKMAETIEYANENTAIMIGNIHHFTIKVDGDTYTQLGTDNQFNEVWKRVK